MKALKRPLTGRRRTVTALLAATVLLGGAGAATAVAVADDGDHDSTLATSSRTDLKQAADTARKSVAGTVTSVDLEGQQGKAVWKVDIVTDKGVEHEVTVNAADGELSGSKVDQDDDRDADAALAKSPRIDLGQAVDAALTKVPGAASSAELDDDNARTAAWHVDVTDANGADHEVTVDARSGKVAAAHTDHDDSGHSDGNGPSDDRTDG
ncbi:PepSY domain-containing protein [Streptomyces sp. TLI_185]|uniref:PepSY domain-containing protein n=1 Tax=Streptomyces sp. TLI_185 TaxID=2485151 RepID=UPI000F51769F|nr:PepSY domain-containing protein [Streptomyces sp. TLI_185]RPF39007.1 putative membrane protein YkoI [Streptomyces sp. TLI_185]